jgi:hypothetical protein
MATEEDKTNSGVAATAIAVGVAAMMAGSAALVGMARSEMDVQKQDTQGYADLTSINTLKAEQAQKLVGAKTSIDKARASTLMALKRDPEQASPWTPKSASPQASSAAAQSGAPEGEPAASGATSDIAPPGAASADVKAAPVDNTKVQPPAPAESTQAPEEQAPASE